MDPSPLFCDLCGLPLRHGSVTLDATGKTFYFCCLGCQQVYRMLVASSDAGDPASFRETDLFKKCLEMGIIPQSESELRERAQKQSLLSSRDLASEVPGFLNSEKNDTEGASLTLGLCIDGMWCPACAWVIDETLKKNTGVKNAFCNFSTDRLRCEYDPILTSPAQIIEQVRKLGYRAHIPGESLQIKENRKELIRFAIACFLTMNVMMLSFALYSGFFSDLPEDAIKKISWPIFIMATIVLFYGGFRIFQKSLIGITNAAYSMETLVSIGAFSAYAYSCYSFFTGSIHQYFDTAAMLVTLVLLGKLIERRAKRRVQEDLEKFFLLMPGKVRICTPSQPEGRYVNIGQLDKNDLFRVEEGETVPADGIITKGGGSVDESSITGEPLPVTKKPGERIRSGTKVKNGEFTVRAEGVGEDSILGQMIQVMENALEQKSPVEGSTDFILKWFVPVLVLLAFSTGVVSLASGLSHEESFMRSIAVLVIACPCALGIAIPLARVAGVSLSGKKGILVRNFSSFSQAEKVNTFIFDKTGTITQGKWSLRQVIPFENFTKDEVLSMASALERDSEHYIAVELREHVQTRQVTLSEVNAIQTYENGIIGWFGNKEIRIGSLEFLQDAGTVLPSETAKENHPVDSTGSRVFMSYDGRLCAIIIFGDEIREGSFSATKKLKSLGHQISLVSGDGKKTTSAVGRRLGIERSYGGKLPHEKALLVEEMQQNGHRVSMVGDGVNDAPALAMSDLSFAVYSGSNISKEAADVTLMRADPEQILDFLYLAKRVRRKISQNLLLSFCYNVVSIPVAMTGLLTPIVAVSAMLMSSLTVIGNTLLLIKKS